MQNFLISIKNQTTEQKYLDKILLERTKVYLLVNEHLILHFQDVGKAVFFSFLIKHFLNTDQENPWFTLTYNQIKQKLYLSTKKQRQYVKELVEEGFINRKMMGLPAKQYLRILKAEV